MESIKKKLKWKEINGMMFLVSDPEVDKYEVIHMGATEDEVAVVEYEKDKNMNPQNSSVV